MSEKRQKLFEEDKEVISFDTIDYDTLQNLTPLKKIGFNTLSSLYYSEFIQGIIQISSNLIEINGLYFDYEFENSTKSFKIIIPLIDGKINGLVLEYIGENILYQRYSRRHHSPHYGCRHARVRSP